MEYLIFSPIPTPTVTNPAISYNDNSPITPIGSATRIVTEFVQGLSQLKDATFEEWISFVDINFEQSARFQLILVGETLKTYDIPVTCLPRFFMTLSDSYNDNDNDINKQHFNLSGVSEQILNGISPNNSNTEVDVEVEVDLIEWYIGQNVFKGSLLANSLSSSMKISNLELTMEINFGSVLPKSSIRVLEISSQMECLIGIIDLVETKKIEPENAVKEIIQT
ncbi:uncharacterized protein L201_003885 [Kwoniella dendrophila CBS 6074]|uniref:SMP-LTD domain-containing protein n=1 Tax=Kwoniella dendrophila CBS 6074 TaxID=1295534 RepID=A0AAX4JWP2_9TREE